MDNYFYTDGLESERLITRFLTVNDIEKWSEFFEDAEAIKYLPNPGFTSTKEWSRYWIEKQLNRYANKQYGLQALYDKKTNEFIGQCGLLMQTVDDKTELEVGYHILKKHWGKAFAPEAAKLFMNFAFNNNLSENIISIIGIHNTKSQRVAEKNHLKKEKQTKWNGLDVFVYRIYNNKFA